MLPPPEWAQRGTWKLTKYSELYSKCEKVQKEQKIIVLIWMEKLQETSYVYITTVRVEVCHSPLVNRGCDWATKELQKQNKTILHTEIKKRQTS